jgi:hypothetical protein
MVVLREHVLIKPVVLTFYNAFYFMFLGAPEA